MVGKTIVVTVMERVLSLVILLFFSGVSAADLAVIVRNTDLRDTPSYVSNTVVWLPIGVEVEPLQRKGGWYQIKVIGHEQQEHIGWIRRYTMRTGVAEGTYEKVELKPSKDTLADGFRSFGRSLSGLFSGNSDKDDNQGNLTTTVGIRGLSAQDISEAKPDESEFDKLLTYEVEVKSAKSFAAQADLGSVRVDPLPKPPPKRERVDSAVEK
ncbi:MAG: hypothetical protein AAF434_05805 [Pseudomonadota bacterium]